MSRTDGGAAFPCGMPEYIQPADPGMSLRDYYKGKALAGMLSSEALLKECESLSKEYGKSHEEIIASFCGKIADAMLEERDR